MLSEAHGWASGVKDDQYNSLTSNHSPMECVDGLGNCLSGGKTLLLAIFPSLKSEFSGDDIGSTWHWMTMPFQLSVWRESDF
jgi:hypothetical protein